jgi:hypothetical protein
VIIYDSVSFKLSKDEEARAAVVQFVTTTSEQIAIGMSGEGFEQLARAILMVLDQNPERREWRSANSFLPLQGGGLRWGSSSYPESIIARWDHVRRPRP